MTKKTYQERQEACAKLREMLKPGDTITCILNHCSRSGMQRSIALAIGHANGSVEDISWMVARAIAMPFDQKRGGVKVGGCGMDMGFAVVYELGAALWPKGTAKPHGTRNGELDRAGGYALKHRWL